MNRRAKAQRRRHVQKQTEVSSASTVEVDQWIAVY